MDFIITVLQVSAVAFIFSLIYSVMRRGRSNGGNLPTVKVAVEVQPRESPPAERTETRQQVYQRKLSWREKLVHFTKDPWLVLISMFLLMSLSFTLSAYPVSFDFYGNGVHVTSPSMIGPNMLLAWGGTVLLFCVWLVSVAQGVVAYDFGETEPLAPPSQRIDWSEVEP